MPKQQTNLDMTLTEQAMNRFHEVNELYDGKINKIHHLFYLTNKTTIETFTFCEAMKQDDRRSFVNAMKKEIRDHVERGQGTVVHHNNIPNNALPIKSMWSFKSKPKPFGEPLKHKACLCANGGM